MILKRTKKDKDKKGKSEEEDNDNNSTEIDFDGFESRMILLGESAGRYGDLRAVKGKILYMQYSNAGSSSFEREFKFYDIEEEEESKTIIEGIGGFELSADGRERLLFLKGGNYGVIKIAAWTES
jgi:tricorn protease